MFKMSAKRYIYIILIFLPIFAFSNNYIINGYIKNKHTNKPIKDVDVYLKNLKRGTVSDENGYFIIDALPLYIEGIGRNPLIVQDETEREAAQQVINQTPQAVIDSINT